MTYCAASFSAVVYLAIGNFYSLNAFEPLFWGGCVYLLVRIVNGDKKELKVKLTDLVQAGDTVIVSERFF